MAHLSSIIRKPIITEKANLLREMKNDYVFEVALDANRIEIKKAIEKKFGVSVESVRTVTMHGKKKRSIGRNISRRKSPDRKKAIIRLKAGDKIEVMEGV